MDKRDMKVIEHKNGKKPLAVLAVLDTEKGHQIAERMLRWMGPLYTVHEVVHDGSLYEYEALHYLQQLVMRRRKPALYVHTRGAVNTRWTTPATHRMWEDQFGKHIEAYFDAVADKEPTIACPFTDEGKETWYNGFVTNYAAMKELTIEPNEDRFVFEKLAAGSKVKVKGLLGEDGLEAARKYIRRVYL